MPKRQNVVDVDIDGGDDDDDDTALTSAAKKSSSLCSIVDKLAKINRRADFSIKLFFCLRLKPGPVTFHLIQTLFRLLRVFVTDLKEHFRISSTMSGHTIVDLETAAHILLVRLENHQALSFFLFVLIHKIFVTNLVPFALALLHFVSFKTFICFKMHSFA